MKAKIKAFRTNILLQQIRRKYAANPMQKKVISVPDLSDKHLLIIAPHPDDEVIGCGGLIQQAISSNAKVDILFITAEGKRSIADSKVIDGVNIRILESKKAKKILAYHSVDYLGLEERALQLEKNSGMFKNALAKILKGNSFQYIFVPNHFDMHPDHRATCLATLQTIKSLQQENPKSIQKLAGIFIYEIWGPANATHVSFLSPKTLEKKLAAMACYQTQLDTADYFKIIDEIQSIKWTTYKDLHQEQQKEAVSGEFFELIRKEGVTEYLSQYF